jgi:lysozyme family protein
MYGGFGVPFWFLGIIHRMEGDADPLKQIANGQPWDQKTTIDPRGLGPWASFAESVPDILANYASPDSWGFDLTKIDSDNYPQWLFRCLTWNGLAYNKLTDPNTVPANATPYLYSGTQIGVNPLYVSGKYTSDGSFDPKAKSQQVGVLALMLALKSMGAIT